MIVNALLPSFRIRVIRACFDRLRLYVTFFAFRRSHTSALPLLCHRLYHHRRGAAAATRISDAFGEIKPRLSNEPGGAFGVTNETTKRQENARSEREQLGLFVEAYERATGETFPEIEDSETPDFMGRDAEGRVVGIEITRLRFEQDERFLRRVFAPQSPAMLARGCGCSSLSTRRCRRSQPAAGSTARARFSSSYWSTFRFSDVTSAGTETDRPETGGFDEVWLADYTQVEAFGAVDLFAAVHPTVRGHFATGEPRSETLWLSARRRMHLHYLNLL